MRRSDLYKFQSSPDRQAGRYQRLAAIAAGSKKVSILARPSGRALPHGQGGYVAGSKFQSSPDRQAGRY